MKYIKYAVLSFLAVSLVMGLASCDILMALLDGFGSDTGTTVQERIDAFETDLNDPDRTYLASTHFHSTEMASYSQLKYDEIFVDGPLSYSNATFVFGSPVITTVGDTQMATIRFENRYAAEGTIELYLALDGLDYMITKIVMTIDAQPTLEYVLQYFAPLRGVTSY